MRRFIKRRLISVAYALNGVFLIIKTQKNAWIHLFMTGFVTAAGIFFKVSLNEWLALILAMAVVWVAEGLNTAIERLGDSVSTAYNPIIGKAKDVAAGSVLIASAAAVIIGIIIFLPLILGVLA